jgi:hypothetical protein
MDVADWLQTLPTPAGAMFLKNASRGKDANNNDEEAGAVKHLSTNEFVEKFQASARGRKIMERLESPLQDAAVADMIRSIGSDKYKNSMFGSFKLLASRELLLWWRDKYQIKAKIMQSKTSSQADEPPPSAPPFLDQTAAHIKIEFTLLF